MRARTCWKGAVVIRKVTAKWVAERDDQDQDKRARSRQHSQHPEVHPQARRAQERPEGDRQGPAGDQHKPHDIGNRGLRGEQSALSRVREPLHRLQQQRMQVAVREAGRMKANRQLIQGVEIARVLIDHLSFRLLRPFDRHNMSDVAQDVVPDGRIYRRSAKPADRL